ncbi:MAG TPA: carboxypeptidase-like regulatory domain-containing protein [Candidatus Acidoferrum sp.]|nr:carboxypeptidase-like regulatory domain-containing protein [Candidatus Acidoferrum sp.]
MSGKPAFGQGGATGAISGTVLDVNGGAVAGADVQIINTATDELVRRLTSGADGTFEAVLLPPAKYYVVVNKSGFAEAKATNIEVRVTETTRMTIPLKPGTVTEKIEISAQVTSVETTNATVGQTIGPETVRELPLATQNYQQLLTLSTGAQSELNASAQLGRGVVKIFVNGQREDNNNYLIEGISATDYNVAQSYYVPLPNPDVIQEFKVQTSLYDASQGRNGGGNVNAILRTGTRELHGDVYEFFRNDALNANEFFHNATGQPRPPVKQNIFGASVGGPVLKEKYGFFFVNYQGTRQRSALSPGTQINNPGFPILPSDRNSATFQQELINDFSTPATAPTANNTAGCPAVSLATVDPVVLKLLQFKSNQFGATTGGYLIPSLPGTPGVTVNPDTCQVSLNSAPFVTSKTGKYTDDQFTTNWDREFRGGQDKIGARFFFSDAESLLPFGAGGLQASLGGTLASSISATDLDFPYDIPVSARFFAVNETHLFSPTLVNDFRFGFVRINDSLVNVPPVTVGDLGIDRPTNNITQSIYKFTFNSSGFQIGPTPPADQFQIQNNYNFVDTVSWVKGAHDFRFGGDATRVNLDKKFPQTFNGQLFFVNTPGLTDFQNFLQGSPAASFGGGGVYNHEYRANDFGIFVQDDWKARKNLTVNLGLRLDINGAFHDNSCHIGNIDENLAAANKYPMIYGGCANSLNLTGLQGSGNDSTLNNNYAKNLAPRVGLAYDIGGHNKTVVRAGYGIYFVREDVGDVDQLSFQAPFLPIAFGGGLPGCLSTYFSADAPAGCIPSGFASNPNALPKAGTLDPNFIPCQSAFQGFNGGDPHQAALYGCAAGSTGSIPTEGLFVLAVPRRFVSPSTQQWNLTVQRDLGRQWILEVGYVGTHAIHLRETRTDIPEQVASPANPVTVTDVNGNTYNITQNTFANGPIRSLNPQINGYNGFQIFDNSAYSHYHSLQTTVSRRWSQGYFQAAYTFSKSTDVNSSGNTAFNTAFNDETNLRNGYGLSDFDRPHRLSVSYRYDLPFFAGATGWQHTALGGWAISGITIIQSGTPFSIIDSAAGSVYEGAGYTTTLTGSLAPGGSISKGYTGGGIGNELANGYLNAANFSRAPYLYFPSGVCTDPTGNTCVTLFGDLGRNNYRGPYQQNWDFSLQKNFSLTERFGLRFTTDFFNIWNHANFANPAVTDVEGGSSFGRIISTVGTPRLIQFSLRLTF